jgi:hypothetical protein
LFGDWAVLREWGRRGSPGTTRHDTNQQRADADAAERGSVKRRLRYGQRRLPSAMSFYSGPP